MLKERKIYCLRARPCIFQPGNVTAWGREGVKLEWCGIVTNHKHGHCQVTSLNKYHAPSHRAQAYTGTWDQPASLMFFQRPVIRVSETPVLWTLSLRLRLCSPQLLKQQVAIKVHRLLCIDEFPTTTASIVLMVVAFPVFAGRSWLKCCFTSTETVGLLGTGAQDGHLDFYTAPVWRYDELMLNVLRCQLTY